MSQLLVMSDGENVTFIREGAYAKYIYETGSFTSKVTRQELLDYLQKLKDTGKFKCSHIYKMTPEVLYRKYYNTRYIPNVNWKLFPDMIYADDLYEKLIEEGLSEKEASSITCVALNGYYCSLPDDLKYHGDNYNLKLWLSSCKDIVSRYRVILDNE